MEYDNTVEEWPHKQERVMRIPVLLKANTTNEAIFVGSIDLLPNEFNHLGRLRRTFRRYRDRLDVVRSAHAPLDYRPGPAPDSVSSTQIHEVTLHIEQGLHGVPVAVHYVSMSDYVEAEAMWRDLQVEEAFVVADVETRYATVKMEQFGVLPNADAQGR